MSGECRVRRRGRHGGLFGGTSGWDQGPGADGFVVTRSPSGYPPVRGAAVGGHWGALPEAASRSSWARISSIWRRISASGSDSVVVGGAAVWAAGEASGVRP